MQQRNVEVRIPAGVIEGSRVRVAGEGERGSGNGGSGDLYLRVRLRPHPRFERKGRDLYIKVRVPVTTAVLGGEVEVPTLAGKSLRLEDAAGDSERPGLPPARPRPADDRARTDSPAISMRRSTSPCRRRSRTRSGSTTRRWQALEKT